MRFFGEHVCVLEPMDKASEKNSKPIIGMMFGTPEKEISGWIRMLMDLEWLKGVYNSSSRESWRLEKSSSP